MQGEAARALRGGKYAAGHERDAKPGGDAADDGFDGAELELAKADDPAPGQDLLQPLAIRAARTEHDDLHLAIS